MHLFVRAASTLLPYMISLCSSDDGSCTYGIWGKTNLADSTFSSYTDHSNLGVCNVTLGCDIQPLRADISKGSDGVWSIYDETSTFPLGITTDASLMATKAVTYLVATSTQSIVPFYYDTALLVSVAPTATPTTSSSKSSAQTTAAAGNGGSGGGNGSANNDNNNNAAGSNGNVAGNGGSVTTSAATTGSTTGSSSGGISSSSSSAAAATVSRDFAQLSFGLAMLFAAVAAPLAVL